MQSTWAILISSILILPACGNPSIPASDTVDTPNGFARYLEDQQEQARKVGGIAVAITDAARGYDVSVTHVDSPIYGAGVTLPAGVVRTSQIQQGLVLAITPYTDGEVLDEKFEPEGAVVDFRLTNADAETVSLKKAVRLRLQAQNSEDPRIGWLNDGNVVILEDERTWLADGTMVSGLTDHLSPYVVVVARESDSGETNDVPVISDANLVTQAVADGFELSFSLSVSSKSPVSWISEALEGPRTSLHGGGQGAAFSEGPDGIWHYSRTYFISEWGTDGWYRFTDIRVRNDAQYWSDYWPNPVSAHLASGLEATYPTLQAVSAVTGPASYGTSLTLTVEAASTAPVDTIWKSFDGPHGSIEGGGQRSLSLFEETTTGTWNYSRTYEISPWAPDGWYVFSNVVVENAGRYSSDPWGTPVSTHISDPLEATTPVLQDVTMEASLVDGETRITVTVTASSNAPVDWLARSFNGPFGSIYGGAQGVNFTEVTSETWRYSWTDIVASDAPSGTYYYENIAVENEGELSSDVWPDPLEVVIQ